MVAQEPGSPSRQKSPAKQVKKDLTEEDQREIIFNILEEAHAAAEELPDRPRTAILRELCVTAWLVTDFRPTGAAPLRNARRAQASPSVLDPTVAKRSKDWAEELYLAAEGLPQGSYAKLDAQAASIRAMVPVDDKRALEMLDGLDASDERSAQNQRNYLAMTVFSRLVEKHGEAVVPDLRARAQSMGETGQYPYDAMAAVTSKLSNKVMARTIFNDALASFQHSGDRLNAMFGMLSLLRMDREKLEPWQAHEGALAITDRLKTEIDRERRAYQEGEPMRPGLAMIMSSVREGLKEIDPDLAATLPELPPYKPSPARQRVGDNTPPSVAVTPEAKRLRTDFDKTSTRLMEMSESEIHGGAELQQVIEKGVDQGVELLHASTRNAKDHLAALQSAMPSVTDFVQVGARTNPAMTLAAVRKVQDSEVKARMLLVIASGLPDPRYKGW